MFTQYRLKDLLAEKGYIRGPFGSALRRGELLSCGIPVYEQQNAIYDHREFRYYVSQEKANSLARFYVQPGDLVISCSGTVGEVTLIKPSDPVGIISQALLILRPNQHLIKPEYLMYFFRSHKGRNNLLERASGSVQVNINRRSVIEDISVDVPDLQDQLRILEILSSIDSKIAVNNKINGCLLEQAQTIFVEHYVQMVNRGTNNELLIRDIPHVLETGKRPKGGATTFGIPSVGAENVKELGKYDYSSTKYIPNDFALSLKKGWINGYELLIYKDGGKPGTFIPHFSMFGDGFPFKGKFCINEHVFKLDFGVRGLNIFAYFLFQTPPVYRWIESNGAKAAIPGINSKVIEEIPFPRTDNPLLIQFGKDVEPLFVSIFANCRQNSYLAGVRDYLLPKLMSGEIDVDDIEV